MDRPESEGSVHSTGVLLGVSPITRFHKVPLDKALKDECGPCIRTISLFEVVRRTRLVGPGDRIAAAAASLAR
jgi:hypothetical protein